MVNTLSNVDNRPNGRSTRLSAVSRSRRLFAVGVFTVRVSW